MPRDLRSLVRLALPAALAGCALPAPPPAPGPPAVSATAHAPERVPARITPGRVVEGETMDPGDVDEFRFTGREGQKVTVYYQAREHGLSLILLAAGDEALATGSALAAPGLRDRFLPQVTLPASGEYVVQVHPWSNGAPVTRPFAYRLVVEVE